MFEFFDNLSPFWAEALSDPLSWTFWEIIAYSAALIANAALIWAILRLIVSSVSKRIFPKLYIFSINLHLDIIVKKIDYLKKDMEQFTLYFDKPQYFMASVVGLGVRSASLALCGIAALTAIPGALGLLLGIPLLGLSLLVLRAIKDEAMLMLHSKKYIEKEVSVIEKSISNLEKLDLGAIPKLGAVIEDSKGVVGRFRRIANLIDSELPTSKLLSMDQAGKQ